MGRTTKPGEPPDMRTLDDPEPPQIPGITSEMLKAMPQLSAESMKILPSQEPRADALRVGNWVVRPARPNAWRRFWMWFLLGWKWEKLR